MIADGELDFYCYTACGFEDLQIVSKLFGEEIVFKGYPSSTGSGSILVPETTYAISSTCMDKQAAWEFLRTFLTEEYQWDSKLTADGYMQAFPTNKKALENLRRTLLVTVLSSPPTEKRLKGKDMTLYIIH